MLLELIILIVTMLVVWDYVTTHRIRKVLREQGFKGPRTWPVLGNALLMIGEGPETVFDLQQRLIDKYGKTMRIAILQDTAIMTTDMKMMEAIYSSQQIITKNRLYDLLHSWLGGGLLLSTGKKWFTRRRIITPTFHFKILEQFVEVFDQQSATMAKLLYARADGKTAFNMFPVACLAALDIIAETAMGVKINAQNNPDFPYVQSVKTVSGLTAKRLMNPMDRFDTWMRFTSPLKYRTLMANIKAMHDFTDTVIEERRATLEKSIADGTYKPPGSGDDNELGTKKRMALLDVLLQSTIDGNPLSNADVREEVDTFMFEGHDTTTSGISYALYLIARHPLVQQRVFAEIRDVIGDDKDKPVTMRDLGELKYLDCVIKEALRMYPPVPIIGRCAQEDVTLGGKLIPAKTNILVLTYNAMRDPDYFPEPELFKPERFGPDADTKINAFAYTPFSAGPRNCVGQKFAMLEMKSTISKMIRHFELLPLGPEVKPLMSIILRSTTGIHLGIKPRVY